MNHKNRTTGASTSSTMRKALKAVLFRDDGRTVITECRRCGTTLEADAPTCSACGCEEIATYRID